LLSTAFNSLITPSSLNASCTDLPAKDKLPAHEKREAIIENTANNLTKLHTNNLDSLPTNCNIFNAFILY